MSHVQALRHGLSRFASDTTACRTRLLPGLRPDRFVHPQIQRHNPRTCRAISIATPRAVDSYGVFLDPLRTEDQLRTNSWFRPKGLPYSGCRSSPTRHPHSIRWVDSACFSGMFEQPGGSTRANRLVKPNHRGAVTRPSRPSSVPNRLMGVVWMYSRSARCRFDA